MIRNNFLWNLDDPVWRLFEVIFWPNLPPNLMTFWFCTERKQIGVRVGQIYVEGRIQTGGSCLVAVGIGYEFQLLRV